jgi:hypothetical protein
MKRVPGTNIVHTHNRPDCGWKGALWVHPNDVNFYRVEIREKDSTATATGSYTPFHGIKHGHYPPPDNASGWFLLSNHTDADGSQDPGMQDNIYSGDPGPAATGAAPPFTAGTMFFPITWQWRVLLKTPHNFGVVRQRHQIFPDGRCTSSKGGHSETTHYTDPTSV